MEKSMNKRFAFMLITSMIVIVMAVAAIASFVTVKPVLAEEDYGIEPYFCNDRTETVVIGGEQFKYKFDGNDVLWPFADSIKVTITSTNGRTFKYNVKITFYYHLGADKPENSDVYDVSTWSGTATKNVTFEAEGIEHIHYNEKDKKYETYKKHNVIRARIDITLTCNNVTDTRAYDLLYHQ